MPYISCVKTSRPKLSVPSHASDEGGSYSPPISFVGLDLLKMNGPRRLKINKIVISERLNQKRLLCAVATAMDRRSPSNAPGRVLIWPDAGAAVAIAGPR